MLHLAPDAPPLSHWSAAQAAALNSSLVRGSHRLHELELFADDALVRLLDRHPRGELQAFTMGTDPTRPEDWKPVEIGDATGAELMTAVARGRLWLNILNVNRAHDDFAALQDALLDELADYPSDRIPGTEHLVLLISSPRAMVYFHADPTPNVLWHVRGEKRLWVYPANNDYFVDRTTMEDIFAFVRDEELPYRPEFDDAAMALDLRPGQFLAWPLNSPHRVENGNVVNVSLSAEFDTRQSRRRTLVYTANRFFTRKLRLPWRDTRETGPGSAVKRFLFRAARKARLTRSQPRFDYVTELRIDAAAPQGVSPLDGPVRTAFAVGDD
ncbi:MAG: hypothetical protein ACT4PI_02325 [Actinomycetota bacterium]